MKIRIRGGRIYDPANGVDGEVRDLFIDDGIIVDAPDGGFAADRTIDASGRVVLPGGVDIHCHIAGPAVNRARRLTRTTRITEPDRAGRLREFPLVPSPTTTGLRYSALGYTTAIDAAIAPAGSRHGHLELADTPNVDCGFLLLLANNEFLLDLLSRGERELATHAAAWLLRRTGAFGIKAVNAGGVAHWKRHAKGIYGHGDKIDGFGVSPRDVLEFLADVTDTHGLPHALHVHCSRLGMPGNISTTLETSRGFDGRRHHLTHVQFHSYGEDDGGGFTSAAADFVEHFHAHPEITADVGQVMFGEALTISADEELEYRLWQLTGKPWVNLDTELEAGCGVVPIEYRPLSHLHALQWAIGLELFLLCEDPWRLSLSTDHPNGGSFITYPALIAQLMDEGVRRDAIERANASGVDATRLKDLSREYTLSDIAIITRAGPARSLGLTDRGHLGPGARGDVTIYDDSDDREAMFRWPIAVIHGGQIAIENGEFASESSGESFRLELDHDVRAEAAFRDWFSRYGSFSAAQIGLSDGELATLPAKTRASAGGDT